MPKIILRMPYPFEKYSKDIQKQYSIICRKILLGDRKVFDNFCPKIYPFCLKIHEIGKDLTYSHEHIDNDPNVSFIDTPNDTLIYSVGANISAYILPVYKNYLHKSEALHEMVCNVINDEKLQGGRCSFITEIWAKTKRSDGVNISKLLEDKRVGSRTVKALLALKDGRFVQEVQKLQKLVPNDWYKKKIALYIERYGNG